MNIALTGTPGTGKSTVSKQLRKSGYTVHDLNEIVISNGLTISYDESRETQEVDLEGLNNYIKHNIITKNNGPSSDFIFFEGHLAHLIDNVELVIVLRCHPDELNKRLNEKDWNKLKIRENLEAETVDTITIECVIRFGENKVFEIDTTSKTQDKIQDIILNIIKGNTENYKPGNIDWSEEILKWY
jgi:adenylate kinase